MLTTQNDETHVHQESVKAETALREWVTPDFKSIDLLSAAGIGPISSSDVSSGS